MTTYGLCFVDIFTGNWFLLLFLMYMNYETFNVHMATIADFPMQMVAALSRSRSWRALRRREQTYNRIDLSCHFIAGFGRPIL